MTEPRALSPITLERLAAIRSSWEEIAGPDEFAVELSRTFDSLEQQIKTAGDTSPYSEVFDSFAGETMAILELYNTRQGTLTKLLTVHLNPRFWGAPETDESREALIDVYATSITLVITLGFSTAPDGIREIKMFGRSNRMHEILRSIAGHWRNMTADSLANSTAAMEGRWLKITI